MPKCTKTTRTTRAIPTPKCQSEKCNPCRAKRKRKASFLRWFYTFFSIAFVLNVAYIVQLKEELYHTQKKVKELKQNRSELYETIRELKEKSIALESEIKGYFKAKPQAKTKNKE